MAIIFCPHCGLQQTQTTKPCKLCHSPLPHTGERIDELISADTALMPFKEIVRQAKTTSLAFKLFLLPLLIVIYFYSRTFKKPLYANVYLSKFPKIRILSPDSPTVTINKQLQKSTVEMSANNFAPLFDYEDLAMAQKNCCRLFLNKEDKIYALTEVVGQKNIAITTTTFLAYSAQKKVILYVNDFEHPLTDPPTLIRRNLPTLTPSQLLDQMQQDPVFKREKTILLKPGNFLILRQKIRSHLIEQSLREGYFAIRPKENQVKVCSHHTMLPAEGSCSVCQTPLCGGCIRDYKEAIYCETCIPSHLQEANSAELFDLPTEFNLAGFGIRTFAALLDLIIFLCIIGIITYGIISATPLILPPLSSERVTWFISQLYVVLFFVFYLAWPLMKFGKTPGQAILGLKIVDRQMNPVSGAGVFVRTGYHLLSALFIFPILGYCFSLFSKTKQGLHDKISGTLIITRRAKAKAITAWLLLLCLAGGTIGIGSNHMGSAFSFVYEMIFNYQEPEIALEPIWLETYDNSFIAPTQQNDLAYVFDSNENSLKALSTSTGETIWQRHDITYYYNLTSPDFFHDVLIITTDVPSKPDKVMLLSRLSGTVFWEKQMNNNLFLDISACGDNIFIMEDPLLYTYNINGRLLWQKKFPGLRMGNFSCNKEIVARFYNDETGEGKQYYLAKTDGKTIWQRNGSGQQISNGFQYENDYDNKILRLLRLRDQKIIWETPNNGTYLYEHIITSPEVSKEDIPQGLLYESTRALRIQDGQVAFTYPKGYNLLKLSDDFLILLNSYNNENQKKVKEKNLLILNQESGETLFSAPISNIDLVRLLGENRNNLFFITTKYEDKNKINASNTLLTLNKQTGATEQKYLGKNLNTAQVNIVNDQAFISTSNSLGMYDLYSNDVVEEQASL